MTMTNPQEANFHNSISSTTAKTAKRVSISYGDEVLLRFSIGKQFHSP